MAMSGSQITGVHVKRLFAQFYGCVGTFTDKAFLRGRKKEAVFSAVMLAQFCNTPCAKPFSALLRVQNRFKCYDRGPGARFFSCFLSKKGKRICGMIRC